MSGRTESPRSLKLASLDAYLGQWKSFRDQEGLHLDWSEVLQFETAAATVIANALLGSFGTIPIEVTAPTKTTVLQTPATAGVLFALANREGPTRLNGVSLSEADGLGRWRESFAPRARWIVEGMFGPEVDELQLFPPTAIGESGHRPSMFGRYHAVFANPHLSAPISNRTEVTRLVRPWLDRVLPQLRPSLAAPASVTPLRDDVGVVIDELIENVREHATRTSDGRPAQSLALVAVTRGGSAAYNRLHLSVQDTGPGIVETARWKLGLLGAAESRSDEELLLNLFDGQSLAWYRGRGLGLPAVWSRCQEHGGTLEVMTGAARVSGNNGCLKRHAGFPLAGSVITITLPLPALAD
jgi:hypothetical protein